jgi:hypothetical protein
MTRAFIAIALLMAVTPAPGASAPWQAAYAVPHWQQRLTRLSPTEEAAFLHWARVNSVPLTRDYDMRGFWKSGMSTQVNPNDHRIHYSDRFKTPLHRSFSGESIYADQAKRPPMWNDRDQLVAHDGTVIVDERSEARAHR